MRSPFELHTFEVGELRPGSPPGWSGAGCLDVDLDALATVAAQDRAITTVRAEIVRPGEEVRLVNVLDVVEPATKPDDAQASFPGIVGGIRPAGQGRTVRLAGSAVVALIDLDRTHADEARERSLDGDAVIDMSGPGACCTHWSTTNNIVLTFEATPSASLPEVDRAIRHGLFAVADAIAATAAVAEPDSIDLVDLSGAREGLPTVCLILQVGSEGPLQDTILYGRPLEGIVPTLLEAGEVLDGALVNGAFDWAGVRNPTFFYQRNELVLRLIREHGKRVNFAGVVLALAYLSSATDKARSALQAAKLAAQIGADAAIVCGFASGNSQTDLMLTIRACEQFGLRTVGLAAETNGGLTDHLPEADSLVSVGNADEFVPGWAPARVVGGAMRTVSEPLEAVPLPLISYFGSVSQLGNTRWRAVWN